MFSLKTDRTKLKIEAKVSFENLSSYDLNVGIGYSEFTEDTDATTLRYEGADGKSLLEVSLRGSLITGISLICFNGNVEVYDSNFTKPEFVETSIFSYQLCMDEKVCELRIAPHEIDQRRDFSFLLYKDVIVFLTGEGEIYSSNRVSDELSIVLGKNGLVIGFAIFSEENVVRFSETYGNR